MSRKFPIGFPYTVAVTAVLLVTAIRYALDPVLGVNAPVVPFLIAVAFAAWLGGFGPGMLSTVLGGIIGVALFVVPARPNAGPQGPLAGWLGSGIPFLLAGTIISSLASQAERARTAAKEKERDARANEAFLRRLMASSRDCIKVLDLNGNLVSINDNAAAVLELDDLTPLLGTCWADWWNAERATAAHAVEEAKAGRTGHFVAFCPTGRGTAKWWDVTVTPIPGEDGRPEKILSMSRDVTPQREADAALRRTEEQQRRVFESVKDFSIFTTDLSGVIDTWSLGAEHLFGYAEPEAVGRPMSLIFTPEDRAAGVPDREVNNARTKGRASDDRWHLRKDDSRFYASGVVTPLLDQAGEIVGYTKVARDITERQVLLQQLAEARRRSDSALIAGEVGTFEWDVVGDRLYGDENFARMFDVRLDRDCAAPLADYVARIHPDDRDRVNAAISEAVSNKADYVCEYRIVTADRGRWVLARGSIVCDDAGRPVRFPGVVLDISARKQAEDKLRESEERLRLALDSARLGWWHVDPVSGDVIWDERAREIFGVGDDRTEYHVALNRIHPDDRERVGAAVEAATRPVNPAPYDETYRVTHADGVTHWVRAQGKAFFSGEGTDRHYTRFTGTFEDVTAHYEEVRRTAFLADLGEAARRADHPDAVMAVIVDRLGAYLRAGRCVYAEADDDQDGIHIRYDWTAPNGNAKSLVGHHRLSDFGHRAYAELRAGRTVAINDTEHDSQTADAAKVLASAGIGAMVDVPVSRDGRLVTVLAVHDTKARTWTADEIKLVEAVADRGWSEIERTRAVVRVAESEARFRAMTAATSNVIYRMTPDWGTLEQLEGRSFIKTTDGPSRSWLMDYVPPEDREQVMAGIDKAIRTKGVFQVEHRVNRVDGTVGWAMSRAVPMLDEHGEIAEWFGAATDVTEQHRLAEERQRHEARYRLLFDAIDQGFCVIDVVRDAAGVATDWVYREANAEFFRQTGLPESTLGRTTSEVVPTLERHWVELYGKVASTGVPQSYVNYAEPLGRWYEVYAFAVEGYRDRVGVLFKDVTERRALSESREQALRESEAARQAAEQAGRLKDDFLATISHELRTPLSAITGWATLLPSVMDDPTMVSEGVDVIGRNAAVQTQLIEDILDMSRITTGKVRLSIKQLDLRTPIKAAIDTVANAARAKGITIETDHFEGRAEVAGDADRLQQVFWNLLSNAIKFTDRGGRVVVRLGTTDSRLVVDIIDDGKGIDAGFLPYVFDRFRQADMSSTRRQGGLGLGLSIVRQLVELHGGTIKVASDGSGKGSTFTVDLPYTAVEHEEHPEHHVAVARRAAVVECTPALDGARVLVIDDEPDARRIVQATLMRCGTKVTTLASVSEAIGILMAEHSFDAIISDIGMPDEDGYVLMQRLKTLQRSGRIKAVPIAALTAYTRDSDRTAILDAGFDYYLAKPVAPAELLQTVTRMIESTKTA